jgi:hypothetical protein
MKQFKPQTLFLFLLFLTLTFCCKKNDQTDDPGSYLTAVESDAMSSTKWKHLANWESRFGVNFRDLRQWSFDTSYLEILTDYQYMRFDKNFKAAYSYPFISPSRGNFRFDSDNSFYYTIYNNSSGSPTESLIAKHYPNPNTVSTFLSSIPEFIGDSTPNLVYTLIDNNIGYAAYFVENRDSAITYTMVLQFDNNLITRTRIDALNWAKANILVQKSPSGILLESDNKLIMVNQKGQIVNTNIVTPYQVMIGTNPSGEYVFLDKQSGKLQTTSNCITWQDKYSDKMVRQAMQSFDKRYLLMISKNNARLNLNDITILDLEGNKTFEFKDDVDFEYRHFWVKGNTLYVFNSDGFYGRLLK